MRNLALLGLLAVLLLVGSDVAFASIVGNDHTIVDVINDYQSVRKVGLALAALAFLMALARLGSSENPHERSRAQDTLVLALVVFVILAGDRMIVRGVIEWFGLTTDVLPPFWW